MAFVLRAALIGALAAAASGFAPLPLSSAVARPRCGRASPVMSAHDGACDGRGADAAEYLRSAARLAGAEERALAQ